jgi:hypothetical protein
VNAVRLARALLIALTVLAKPAWAGPPYVTDDPEPTDFKRFEIYLFANGSDARDGSEAATGIDFNYGAAPDLQLTALLPLAYENPLGASSATGLGNIELAAKYRFLHQAQTGWDVAVFPRYILPSVSSHVGDQHSSIVLPIWLEKDWDTWSTFGGGGCVIQHESDLKNFCLAGWALTRTVLQRLQIGLELVYRSADTPGGHASAAMGAGLRYDITTHYHFLASAGPTLRNASETTRYSWYASLLFTF